jgi:rhodanese-related sulfurtransferase
MAKSLRDFVDEALKSVREVTPEEALVMSLTKDWLVIDVREPYEFEEGHIPGSINFPRGFLEVRADLDHHKKDERLQSRDQRILCYCGGGHRSAMAARVLQEMGFKEAVSMKGGWTAYIAAGLPSKTP